MLCTTSYGQEYIDTSRVKIEAQVRAFHEMAAAGASLDGAEKERFDAAVATFEPVFFNNLVLAMDNYFTHRSRMLELKDGNPANEVRLLCSSLTANGGALVADKQIKLNPETSVLGYRTGDDIRLTAADFERLAKGFFAEMEDKFR